MAHSRQRGASAVTGWTASPACSGGKADAQVTCVDPALEHDQRAPWSPAHHVSAFGDRWRRADRSRRSSPRSGTADGGVETVRFSADVVVVARGRGELGAAPASAFGERPASHGPGQRLRSGRPHYVRHNNLAPMACRRSRTRRGSRRRSRSATGIGLGDDWKFPMGGIQMFGKCDGEQIRAKAPHWATWGAKLTPGVRRFEVVAHHAVDFWLCGEDLPAAGEPCHPRERRSDPPHPRREEQRRGAQAPAARAAAPAQRPRHARSAC